MTETRYGDLGSARVLGRLVIAAKPATPNGRGRVPTKVGADTDLERFRYRAACQHADPELFFGPDPEYGHELVRERRARVQAAMDYCDTCDVRDACLAWALANGERGIWGGTTEDARDELLGRAPKNPPRRRPDAA